MSYKGRISTKPGSKKVIDSVKDLIKGKGGVYTVETECREGLCTTLAYGNSLLHDVKHLNGNIRITTVGWELNQNFIDRLNSWLSKTVEGGKVPAILSLKDNWIHFDDELYSSLPLISTVAFLAWNFRDSPIDDAIKLILYDWDCYFEMPDMAFFTAYFIWRTQNKFTTHPWWEGAFYDGPASYAPVNFFYEIKLHRQFYRSYRGVADQLYYDDTMDNYVDYDYWKIITEDS